LHGLFAAGLLQALFGTCGNATQLICPRMAGASPLAATSAVPVRKLD